LAKLRTPEYIERDPCDPKPTAEEDIKMEYFSDYLCNPIIGTVTKNYL